MHCRAASLSTQDMRSVSMSHICWCLSLIRLHLQPAGCDAHPGIIGNVCLTLVRFVGIKTRSRLSGVTLGCSETDRDGFYCRCTSVSAFWASRSLPGLCWQINSVRLSDSVWCLRGVISKILTVGKSVENV